jgi:hypothetical protein
MMSIDRAWGNHLKRHVRRKLAEGTAPQKLFKKIRGSTWIGGLGSHAQYPQGKWSLRTIRISIIKLIVT